MKTMTTTLQPDWFTVGRPAQDEPRVQVNVRTGAVQVLPAQATEAELRIAWRRFAKTVVGDRT